MHTPKRPLAHINSEHRGNSGRWLKAGSIGVQVGVHLSKDLMAIAGRSLKANITTLGPLVLPFSEQLLFLANLVSRKVRPLPLMCIVDAHVFPIKGKRLDWHSLQREERQSLLLPFVVRHDMLAFLDILRTVFCSALHLTAHPMQSYHCY